MKDEIKEIELDHFKDLKELKQNVENWLATDEMYWERWFGLYDLKILLDYITNLQEENKRIFSKVNDDELLISNAMNYAETQEYKSRNEKALEINQKLQSMYILDSRAIFWLSQQEKVLQGEDKDVKD